MNPAKWLSQRVLMCSKRSSKGTFQISAILTRRSVSALGNSRKSSRNVPYLKSYTSQNTLYISLSMFYQHQILSTFNRKVSKITWSTYATKIALQFNPVSITKLWAAKSVLPVTNLDPSLTVEVLAPSHNLTMPHKRQWASVRCSSVTKSPVFPMLIVFAEICHLQHHPKGRTTALASMRWWD